MNDVGMNLRVIIETFDHRDERFLVYVGGKMFVDRSDADFFAVTDFGSNVTV